MLSFAALYCHVVSSDPALTPGSPTWLKMPMATSSSPLDAQADLTALLAAFDDDHSQPHLNAQHIPAALFTFPATD